MVDACTVYGLTLRTQTDDLLRDFFVELFLFLSHQELVNKYCYRPFISRFFQVILKKKMDHFLDHF